MRHVRHVEQPERDREPDADRGVETAEKDPGEYRLEEKLYVQRLSCAPCRTG
jgi:hypothetical protein